MSGQPNIPTPNPAALMLLDEKEVSRLDVQRGEILSIAQEFLDQPIKSDEEAAKITNLGRRASITVEELERIRKQAVEPLNKQVKLINSFFATYTSALAESIIERAKYLLTTYQQQVRDRVRREQEEQRRREEEAAQRQREAEERLAAAKNKKARDKAAAEAEAASAALAAAQVAMPAPAPKHIKTEQASAIRSEVYVLQGIHDIEQVPKEYWRNKVVIEALEKVLRAAVRTGTRSIPGCSIGPEDRVAFRA